MEYLSEYTRFFTALRVILDPFAAMPVFLSLTHDYPVRERGRMVNITALTVTIVLSLAALGGEQILTAIAVEIMASGLRE